MAAIHVPGAAPHDWGTPEGACVEHSPYGEIIIVGLNRATERPQTDCEADLEALAAVLAKCSRVGNSVHHTEHSMLLSVGAAPFEWLPKHSWLTLAAAQLVRPRGLLLAQSCEALLLGAAAIPALTGSIRALDFALGPPNPEGAQVLWPATFALLGACTNLVRLSLGQLTYGSELAPWLAARTALQELSLGLGGEHASDAAIAMGGLTLTDLRTCGVSAAAAVALVPVLTRLRSLCVDETAAELGMALQTAMLGPSPCLQDLVLGTTISADFVRASGSALRCVRGLSVSAYTPELRAAFIEAFAGTGELEPSRLQVLALDGAGWAEGLVPCTGTLASLMLEVKITNAAFANIAQAVSACPGLTDLNLNFWPQNVGESVLTLPGFAALNAALYAHGTLRELRTMQFFGEPLEWLEPWRADINQQLTVNRNRTGTLTAKCSLGFALSAPP